MLFGRRTPENWRDRLRVAVWPRRSWARSFQYVTKRIMRLTASPHSIAAGVAAGVFASFTPFMGFHFLIAFGLAYLLAGNFLAAGLGTFVGNPLTFPVIWASTYATGRFILLGVTSGEPPTRVTEMGTGGVFSHGFLGAMEKIADLWNPVLKPMTVGGIPLGIAFAVFFYFVTRSMASGFRAARGRQIAEKAAAIRARGDQATRNAPQSDQGEVSKDGEASGKTLMQGAGH